MADKKNDKLGEGGGLPKIAIVGIIAVVVIIVAVVILSKKQDYKPVIAGADAMDFTLPDVNGKMHSLKDYRGKVVFLNFWATWCKPCEEEMPSMQGLYQYLSGQPFEILAVSIDADGNDGVIAYAKKYGLTFPILRDKDGRIKEMYKTTGVPETFIIDQNGVIAEKVWGQKDWSLRESLTVVLKLIQNGPQPRESYKPVAR